MTAGARRAAGKVGRWLLAVLLLFGFVLLMALLDVAGLSRWLAPAAASGLVGWSLLRPDWTWLGLGRSALRKTFGVIAAVTALFALGLDAGDRKQEDARQIVALGRSDPAQAASRLAAADEMLLAEVGRLAPALEKTERDRRALAEKGKQRADAAKAEQEEARSAEREKAEAAETEARDKLDHPERFVRLEPYDWYKDGFGSVMMLNATIRNDSGVDLKDFTVRCEHSAPSGTVMDSNTRVIYERVPAGGSKRVRGFNMGLIASQAVSSSCEVTDAERA